METIKVVFTILMIQNGATIEMVPVGSGVEGMTNCLEQKRIVTRSTNAENQEGLIIKVELWEDCTGDICRTKIKRIVE